ncbi:hypothetical protein DUNSADRAFT_16287 [Dunaliella salina]|uniref:MATH domain-containing protein n=1 Tax=Dunaliella salina TaxID=3046 RepID=A0ABQ7G3Z5_DUNSA|nr:hypothetical protein DUNSADRAFT_16287 [Dunaliella salina]|eukprot:KAF5829307.1 hypothetical protein DUNSADRAFT_16287 [Dunaliella salina]
MPQQQPDQQSQQQQQQQPHPHQQQSSAPGVHELPAPALLPPSILPSSQKSPSQQPSPAGTSPASTMVGPGNTAADALSAADAQGAQQFPGNNGLDPSALLNALFVPGGSGTSSGAWMAHPQQPGSSAAPNTPLPALSGLGTDLTSLAQLPGLGPGAPDAPHAAIHACAAEPGAHAAAHACSTKPSAHAATHACATQNGSTGNIQGSCGISQDPAGTSQVSPGACAAPVASTVAGTAENAAETAQPVPPSAPPIPGPRVNDGRVFIPLQIIHDHYDREDYPLKIRAHVFVNHVLLAKGMEAKMVRYRKSANRANHFCMGLRGIWARFNDVRSHCVEQDEDGCLKISLLAA